MFTSFITLQCEIVQTFTMNDAHKTQARHPFFKTCGGILNPEPEPFYSE